MLCHDPGGRAPSPPQHQPPRRDPVHPPCLYGTIILIGFVGYVCATAGSANIETTASSTVIKHRLAVLGSTLMFSSEVFCFDITHWYINPPTDQGRLGRTILLRLLFSPTQKSECADADNSSDALGFACLGLIRITACAQPSLCPCPRFCCC